MGVPHRFLVEFSFLLSYPDDGKYCVTGGHDRTVRLWNPFRVDPAYVPPDRDSKRVGAKSGRKNEKELAAVPPALPIQTYFNGLTHPVSALDTVTSPTAPAQLLLAATEKTLVISDLVTNQVLRRLQGHSGRINSVAASDDGDCYLSASYDATVCIWDGRARSSTKPIQILRDAKDSVTSVQVVQERGVDKSMASAEALIRTSSVDGIVRTYDVRRGLLKCDDVGSAITGMAMTHDGQCLATSCLDGTIRLIELGTGELLNTYHGMHISGRYALDVGILANDATVVSGSEDGCCVLYDLVRATQVQSLQHDDNIGNAARPLCSIATHPTKSSVVLTAGYDSKNVVWDNDSSLWSDQLLNS